MHICESKKKLFPLQLCYLFSVLITFNTLTVFGTCHLLPWERGPWTIYRGIRDWGDFETNLTPCSWGKKDDWIYNLQYYYHLHYGLGSLPCFMGFDSISPFTLCCNHCAVQGNIHIHHGKPWEIPREWGFLKVKFVKGSTEAGNWSFQSNGEGGANQNNTP